MTGYRRSRLPVAPRWARRWCRKIYYKTRKSRAELLGSCSIRLFAAGFCLRWRCRLIDGGLLLQEGVKTENDHINLKVAGQDGSVVQFKIKRHTALNKLMKAYCERQVCSCPKRPFPPVAAPNELQAAGACALHIYCVVSIKGSFPSPGPVDASNKI